MLIDTSKLLLLKYQPYLPVVREGDFKGVAINLSELTYTIDEITPDFSIISFYHNGIKIIIQPEYDINEGWVSLWGRGSVRDGSLYCSMVNIIILKDLMFFYAK
jgi:hypothetical protein